jgi:hypothetical protein
VQRDGYANAKVRVTRDNDHAHITGVPADYTEPLARKLLDNGELAYQGATRLNQKGGWDFSWYLFLPLGMALKTAAASSCCTSRRTTR